MGIPAKPNYTGDKEKDAKLREMYRKLCMENVHEGDLPFLPADFPEDCRPGKVKKTKPELKKPSEPVAPKPALAFDHLKPPEEK